MINPAAFITIEQTLTDFMKAVWAPLYEQTAKDVIAFLEEGNSLDAHGHVSVTDFEGLLKPHRPRLEELAVAALLLGAQGATGDIHATSYMQGTKQIPAELYNAIDQLITTMERDGAEAYRLRLHEFLHSLNDDQGDDSLFDKLFKAEKSLAERLNEAVMNDTEVRPSVAANLTTSRLVALGYLSEAKELGQTTYQINEILDSRTCPVCRYMHGKTFKVDEAFSRVVTALSTTDPKELKDIAPWPSQTKDGLADLYELSADELASRGFNVPPFHPYCRGYLTITGSVVEEFPVGSLNMVAEILANADPAEVKENYDALTAAVPSVFSDDNKDMIVEWGLAGYLSINRNLRRGIPEGTDKDMRRYYRDQLKRMDDAMTKWALPQDVVLYRGVANYEAAFGVQTLDEIVNKRIKDKGFMSTTASLDLASEFGGTKGAVMELLVPAGTNAIIPEALDGADISDVMEVILPRNLTLKILSVDTFANPPRIKAQVIPKITKSDDLADGDNPYAKTTSRFVWAAGDFEVK